ncbi:DUF397 domain-containing protein [Actinomadura sp. LD22]|uniref:DUF397 domain-containing protein n=1 Tax=Actinomadura physcomitrii TaxID=2650748 RepID=A0A6I4MMI6_9ACTN|nr:DUF397 domain-containing protein [Actinomadura physcomitrii]MWA03949.1 DUF397 domain-containing protein [Actinomadura physcomitrii]
MRIDWRKSSYSGSSTDEMCVEVGELIGGVAIRDSKDPDGSLSCGVSSLYEPS